MKAKLFIMYIYINPQRADVETGPRSFIVVGFTV